MREILLATNNPGKIREMREILTPADAPLAALVRWRFLAQLPNWPKPREDGDTFEANARIKAHYYAQLGGLWTIADDSGLEVDALRGEPGVRSARYAGAQGDDQANNALLLKNLAGVPTERRTARFRCAVVLSDGQRILASAQGAVEGRILTQPQGGNGFGYDPLFLVEGAELTAAEMPPAAKHAVSHRGQAMQRLQKQLLELLRKAE